MLCWRHDDDTGQERWRTRGDLPGRGSSRRGVTARALGASIFTEADGAVDLHEKVRDAVRCHFNPGQAPRIIRLHFVREEVITA